MKTFSAWVCFAALVSCARGDDAAVVAANLDPRPTLDTILASDEVGATAGTPGVSATGAAGYTIPIEVSRGPGGFQPALALTYSSQSGAGPVGVGWSVSGVSSIQRCPSTYAQDGAHRPIQFDGDDALCLDGRRLVRDGSEWNTADGIEHVRLIGSLGSPDSVFVVSLPDGSRRFFGGPNASYHPSRFVADEHGAPIKEDGSSDRTFRWMLAEERDQSGNTIEYRWAGEDEPLLREVRYGGRVVAQDDAIGAAGLDGNDRRVVFEWEGYSRTDREIVYEHGIQTTHRHRLSAIVSEGPVTATPRVFRRYELGYDYSDSTDRSLLVSVRERDGFGRTRNPLTLSYSGEKTPNWYPIYVMDRAANWWNEFGETFITFPAPGTVIPVDVDGDGDDDILYWSGSTGDPGGDPYDGTGYHWFVRLADGAGYGAEKLAGLPGEWNNATLRQITPVDIDRDGADELLHRRRSDDGTEIVTDLYRWNGEQFSREVDDFGGCRHAEGCTRQPPTFVGDFDGNGGPDTISVCADYVSAPGGCINDEPTWVSRFQDGSAWLSADAPQTFDGLGFPGATSDVTHQRTDRQHVVDIDGDGRDEVLTVRTTDVDRFVATGFERDGGHFERASNLSANPDVEHVFLDLNGDDLADALEIHEETVWARINTGAGFQNEASFGLSSPVGSDAFAGRHAADFRVLDVNRDGRDDFIILHEGVEGKFGPTALLFVTRTDVFGFPRFDSTILPFSPGFPGGDDEDRNWQTTRILDWNGDLRPDLINVEDEEVFVHVNSGEYADLLVEVRGDHEEATNWVYQSASSLMSAGTDCHYPQACAVPPIALVSRVSLPTGAGSQRTFDRAYGGARTDVRGYGFLGFDTVEIDDLISDGTDVTIAFDHKDTFVAEPDGVSVLGRYAYRTFDPVASRAVTQLSPTRVHVVDREQTSTVVLLNGDRTRAARRSDVTVTREFQLASYSGELGAATPFRTEVLDHNWTELGFLHWSDRRTLGGSRDRITYSRVDRPLARIFGLPETAQLESWPYFETEPTNRGVRTTTTLFDDRGRPYQLTREGVDSEWLETFVDRDDFGNVKYVRQTGREPDHVEPTSFSTIDRTVEVQYDAEGAFPELFTNEMGHTTETTYHPTLGVLQREVDPNTLTTQWVYDGFGRLRAEYSPTGDAYNVRYSTLPGSWVRATVEGADGSYTTVDYDSFARERRTRVQNPTSDWSATTTTYDARGRVSEVSLPRFESVSGGTPATFSYDGLGRTVASNWAGRSTTFSYNELVATRTNPRGFSRTVTQDSAGRVIRTDEGTDGVVTTYRYAPFGQMEEIDAQGVKWEADYDTWGRRVELRDPDAGLRISAYNSFDELRGELDAVGSELLIERDLLGRTTSRLSPYDGESTYVWDEPSDGLGRLSEACSEDGSVCTAYDYGPTTGLRTRERRHIAGSVYDTDYAYDAIGRLATLSYPNVPGRVRRFALRYTYDPKGPLREIAEVDAVANLRIRGIWAASAWDARGNVSVEDRYSSSGSTALRSFRTYEASTGLLGSVRSLRFSGVTWVDVQNVQFAYDLNGNLDLRTSTAAGTVDDFDYDTLDRLTSWRVGTAAPTIYDHDPHGNLTQIGSLTQQYGPDSSSDFYGPHALRLSGPNRYRYDENGRQVSGGGRTNITYTWEGLPRAVSTASGSHAYSYDAFGHRVLASSSGGGSTTYVGDLLEKRGSQYVFHVFVGAREVAQYTRSTSETVTHVLTDHQHSLDAVTTDTGVLAERFRFDPFGNRVGTTGSATSTHRHRWNSHESDDATGLVNMRGRMYDSQTGRFLSPDPFALAPFSQQSNNAYSYVLNNPTSLRDPSGLWVVFGGSTVSGGGGGTSGLPGGLGGFGSGPFGAGTSGLGSDAQMDAPTADALGARDSSRLRRQDGFDVLLDDIMDFGAGYSHGMLGVNDMLPYPLAPDEPSLAYEYGALIGNGQASFHDVQLMVYGSGMVGVGVAGAPETGGASLAACGLGATAVAAGAVDFGRHSLGMERALSNINQMSAEREANSPPPNMSPPGAGRRGAFREARRASGVPVSQQPTREGPNLDRRGQRQPGRSYEYEVPAEGGRTRSVTIREDSAGHYFGPDDPQNRGPHFNDEAGNHYDY